MPKVRVVTTVEEEDRDWLLKVADRESSHVSDVIRRVIHTAKLEEAQRKTPARVKRGGK